MSKKRIRQLANEIEASITPEVIDAACEKVLSHTVGKGVDVLSNPRARSRNFTAKPCPACVADRPAGSNFSRVFATRGKVRYCRCGYCGHTWKDSDS